MAKKISFLIKAGRNYANNFFRYRIIFSRNIMFGWKINEAAYYDYNKVINGWSKIIGLTDCIVHRSSMRLAWINTKDGLQAGCHHYYNGVMRSQSMASIVPGVTYHTSITRNRDSWTIEIYDSMFDLIVRKEYAAGRRRWVPFLFVLHPYVGGRFTLQNDLKIDVCK